MGTEPRLACLVVVLDAAMVAGYDALQIGFLLAWAGKRHACDAWSRRGPVRGTEKVKGTIT